MPGDVRARTGSSAPTSDPHVGRLLDGRYLVGPRVARGGMASVYEATDVRLDRTVALKIMHAGFADHAGHAGRADHVGDDGDFAARFVREARAAARLSHPNVVAVYDQGEDDGVVFLAMELIDGHTMRDTILTESPMSPARALALMEPVLSALASAHRAGLIHRDVKPENVLIADDGRVKVADFGLAKAISADTQHTATQGVLIGTVAYLAPELVVDGRADARADVYAAGVMLYELLTGVKPHEGETPIAVAYKHVHHDVSPPSQRVPGIPGYVDALVARATARDRDQRPADAGVLLHQLHRVGQALADGVRDDVELTQDLSPLTRAPSRPGDTTPQTWHEDAGHPGYAAASTTTTLLPVERSNQPPPPLLAPEPRRPGRTPRQPGQPRQPREPRQPRQARQPRHPRPPRMRRSRRGPVLLLVALLVAAAVGGGAFWFGYARYTTAPSVMSLSQSDAEKQLGDAGLEVAYADAVYSRSATKGTVIDADPSGGARILPGATVTLTLSLGVDRIPRVRGLSEDDAQDRLLARQLVFGTTVQRYSESVAAGTVMHSRPASGSKTDPGTHVDLVVSKGPRPLKVGTWVGESYDHASEVLTKRGLVPDRSDEYSDTVAAGDVIRQNPVGGTLHRGDHVSFVVSRGPQLVAVPSVKAYTIDAAESSLKAAGFKVTVIRSPEYLGLGFALRTDPSPGTMVRRGSTVVVYEI